MQRKQQIENSLQERIDTRYMTPEMLLTAYVVTRADIITVREDEQLLIPRGQEVWTNVP
jgi:hypothetical protein